MKMNPVERRTIKRLERCYERYESISLDLILSSYFEYRIKNSDDKFVSKKSFDIKEPKEKKLSISEERMKSILKSLEMANKCRFQSSAQSESYINT
ncbi:hypothetical protein [Aliivibrio fischeri]|nr:hypothetical protein [Aliivibrio fischeri]